MPVIDGTHPGAWRVVLSVLGCAGSMALWGAGPRACCSGELPFPNADFELGTLEGWERRGDAFQFQPTLGDNPQARGRESSGHQGKYWIGGFEKYDGRRGKPGDASGDAAVGELVSPEFVVEKPYLTFLIGGGFRPGKAGVKLLCEGQTIELATGADSETMTPASYDVSRFMGQRARLVVFDEARGDWGHVNVDSFRAADEPIPGSTNDFAFAAEIPTQACVQRSYDQPLRPQFHFTACRGWLNDPNGMVYDGRQYHLFFQHNPLAPVWGNMTWGHATSPDMVRWTQQDHALRPYKVDRRAGTIFSGTAIVDHNNSLAVQRGSQKTLCAFYTFAVAPRFYQAMAYSIDGGKTWNYWNEGRPVVENQGFDSGERDPKVFWHEPSRRWVMVLWVQQNPGRVRFFVSQDLKHWEFASDLVRDWAFECMDLVFLPVNGEAGQKLAVLYDASFDYEVGEFDGREFRTRYGPYRAGGGDFYAAQTFNQAPEGRVVQIGWMRGGPNAADAYGAPFNQQMSFPCELSLRRAGDEVQLCALPVAEIKSLVDGTIVRGAAEMPAGVNLLAESPQFDLLDLEIAFEPGSAREVVFRLGGASLAYDCQTERLRQRGVDGQGRSTDVEVFSELGPRDGQVRLRLLIDRLSVESYAFDGERFFAAYFAPPAAAEPPCIQANGGTAQLNRLEIRRLKSAWDGAP